MTNTTRPEYGPITAPRTWSGEGDDSFRALESPWYRLVIDVMDTVTRATYEFGRRRGLRAIHVPLTTRTVTCPTGLGSDSEPVSVSVNGVQTYLSDSAQFLLEYGCRVASLGCYCLLPSFRAEKPDASHLNQFVHSEAEIPGGLDDLIDHVEGYIRFLAQQIVAEQSDALVRAGRNIGHLERIADRAVPHARLTFDEAERMLAGEPGCVSTANGGRLLSRRGERRLLELVGEAVWVTHFDHLSVPFFQAFAGGGTRSANNADLLLGIGEVVGSGERHATGDQVRAALDLHHVPESDYQWYVRMKDKRPMRTSGFGMGTERFMLWVLNHDDIRDIPIVSRVDEEPTWPMVVDRP